MELRVSPWLDLRGKVVIVTGGSQGLGRGIVRALSAAGARLAIAGRNFEAARAAALEAAETQGVEAIPVRADVASPTTAAAWSPRPTRASARSTGL
jgi:NAD(P)-dependent dehydrogenase (short-subunit alcohol dehydrogenase family)